jgi:hypothetical protein
MPTLQTFTELVNGLEGRAKTRPFSLQIHGKFDCQETEFLRMLRASYEPVTENMSEIPVSSSGNESSIRYDVKQDGIDQVLANIISENGTIITTRTLGIRVPSDMPSREAFLRQHALQWNDVEWNDEEAESEEESESDNNDESEDSHESSAEERNDDHTYTEGHSESQDNDDLDGRPASPAKNWPTKEPEDADADEGQPSAIDSEDHSSAHVQADDPPTAPFTIVCIQVPADIDNHNAWLAQHGFGRDSAIWPGVQADIVGDAGNAFIGVGVEMSIHRGNARGGSRYTRFFDPPEERNESYVSFVLGGNGDVDSEDGSDRESAEEDDVPKRVTVLEADVGDDSVEDSEDAQRPSEVEETDFDGDLRGGSIDGELLA